MIVSLKRAVALACLAGLGMSAAQAQTCTTSNQTGTNNGNYFSFWKDTPGTVNFCMYPSGRYTSNWSGINNWVGGKGWATGSSRVVSYSGTFNSPGNGYLTLYGWTTNPLDRVLHRRQLGLLAPAGQQRHVPRHGHQRRRHVRHLPCAARRSAVHRRQQDVLPVLERPPVEARGRHHHHGKPLRRVGVARLEPGNP